MVSAQPTLGSCFATGFAQQASSASGASTPAATAFSAFSRVRLPSAPTLRTSSLQSASAPSSVPGFFWGSRPFSSLKAAYSSAHDSYHAVIFLSLPAMSAAAAFGAAVLMRASMTAKPAANTAA